MIQPCLDYQSYSSLPMSRSRLHAPRCCFDTHPQLQRRTTLAALVDALLCRRPTSMPQLYHRSKCCVNVFCKMVSTNVRKMLPVHHPPPLQALQMCQAMQLAAASFDSLWVGCSVYKAMSLDSERRFKMSLVNKRHFPLPWVMLYTTTLDGVVAHARLHNIQIMARIIIYAWVILSAKIIVSRYARKANEIKGLAQFSAIDLKSLTLNKAYFNC